MKNLVKANLIIVCIFSFVLAYSCKTRTRVISPERSSNNFPGTDYSSTDDDLTVSEDSLSARLFVKVATIKDLKNSILEQGYNYSVFTKNDASKDCQKYRKVDQHSSFDKNLSTDEKLYLSSLALGKTCKSGGYTIKVSLLCRTSAAPVSCFTGSTEIDETDLSSKTSIEKEIQVKKVESSTDLIIETEIEK